MTLFDSGARLGFRHWSIRLPFNCDLRSWRYAVRSKGLWRAILGRGWV